MAPPAQVRWTATVQGLLLSLDNGGQALLARLDNPSIAHATAQIAMDGRRKPPWRIPSPALRVLAARVSAPLPLPWQSGLSGWRGAMPMAGPSRSMAPRPRRWRGAPRDMLGLILTEGKTAVIAREAAD